MKKVKIIRAVEDGGKYCKVKISSNGEITGMLVEQDHRYCPQRNTGGRVLIGYDDDKFLLARYGLDG